MFPMSEIICRTIQIDHTPIPLPPFMNTEIPVTISGDYLRGEKKHTFSVRFQWHPLTGRISQYSLETDETLKEPESNQIVRKAKQVVRFRADNLSYANKYLFDDAVFTKLYKEPINELMMDSVPGTLDDLKNVFKERGPITEISAEDAGYTNHEEGFGPEIIVQGHYKVLGKKRGFFVHFATDILTRRYGNPHVWSFEEDHVLTQLEEKLLIDAARTLIEWQAEKLIEEATKYELENDREYRLGIAERELDITRGRGDADGWQSEELFFDYSMALANYQSLLDDDDTEEEIEDDDGKNDPDIDFDTIDEIPF